jgi:hypothetical protein
LLPWFIYSLQNIISQSQWSLNYSKGPMGMQNSTKMPHSWSLNVTAKYFQLLRGVTKEMNKVQHSTPI